jgi:hypothetical protein
MQRQGRGVDPELFAPSAGGFRDVKATPVGMPATYSAGSMGSGFQSQYEFGAGNQSEMEAAPVATIELEHMSGFTGKNKGTVHAHPTDPDGFITWWDRGL